MKVSTELGEEVILLGYEPGGLVGEEGLSGEAGIVLDEEGKEHGGELAELAEEGKEPGEALAWFAVEGKELADKAPCSGPIGRIPAVN